MAVTNYLWIMKRESREAASVKIEFLNKLLQQAIGQPDIYSVADAKIAGFGFEGVSRMIYSPFEGQLHTGKMMRTLLQKGIQSGRNGFETPAK